MATDVFIDAPSLKDSSHHSSGREGCILSLSSLTEMSSQSVLF